MTDRRTDLRTHGQIDRVMDSQSDGKTARQMDGLKEEQKDVLTNRWKIQIGK